MNIQETKSTKVHCPICISDLDQFVPFGRPQRPNAQCPKCYSLERHRLLWLFMSHHKILLQNDPSWVLHFAPEAAISLLLSNMPRVRYVSADLMDPSADLKMDITNILYPDNSFDLIICGHVLEHVPDDKIAMRELCRVLKPGRFAIIQVPISNKDTFEDPSITDPTERRRLFGQEDHVRVYGLDIVDRLNNAGFTTELVKAEDFLSEAQLERVKVKAWEKLLLCKK